MTTWITLWHSCTHLHIGRFSDLATIRQSDADSIQAERCYAWIGRCKPARWSPEFYFWICIEEDVDHHSCGLVRYNSRVSEWGCESDLFGWHVTFKFGRDTGVVSHERSKVNKPTRRWIKGMLFFFLSGRFHGTDDQQHLLFICETWTQALECCRNNFHSLAAEEDEDELNAAVIRRDFTAWIGAVSTAPTFSKQLTRNSSKRVFPLIKSRSN